MSKLEIPAATQALLAEWAKKRELKVAELVQEYIKAYNMIKELTPGKDEEYYHGRARAGVVRYLKRSRYVRAKPWDGLFFGFGAAFDISLRQRNQATFILETDPEKAHKEGWVDDQGRPVDMRKTLPSGNANPFYNKPLTETFVRQTIGLARPAVGGDSKLLILRHYRDQAFKAPPLGRTVRFLCNPRSQDDLKVIANTSVQTTYDPITMEEFGEITPQKVIDMLEAAPDEYRTTIKELPEWHDKHKDDANRVVIVKGEIGYNPRTALSTGNFMLTVADPDTTDPDAEDTTVWAHSELEKMIQFGSGTLAYILGRTVIGPGYDREKREQLPDVERVMINAFGIWPVPDTIMPIEEANVIESMDTAK